MLRILFLKGRRKIDEISDFNELWESISRLKETDEAKEGPTLMGLQDELGHMILLAPYHKDLWVLESLEEDWGEQFGKIDLAEDFDVRETLLNDEELKKTLATFMAEGKLSILF